MRNIYSLRNTTAQYNAENSQINQYLQSIIKIEHLTDMACFVTSIVSKPDLVIFIHNTVFKLLKKKKAQFTCKFL